MLEIISYQLELCQILPEIIGNIDYSIFKDRLLRIEKIIELYDLEKIVIEYNLEQYKKTRKNNKPKISKKEKIKIKKTSIQALRCNIARCLTQEAYRPFSCRLGDSLLFQYFCRINNFGKIKIPGKSILQRYDQMVPEEIIRKIVDTLTTGIIESKEKINLEKKVLTDNIYYDTTCVETNIHFPVDWVLLRDIVRTSVKAMILIRKEGLKNRMDEPKVFIKNMNKLCMKMTHTRRKKNGDKMRKKIFRKMKRLLKKIKYHTKAHYELLSNNRDKTSLTKNQATQILNRIQNILKSFPAAIHQAHERIIGKRKVESKDKVLSLYETDTNIIVRGKTSAEVEYGNKLLLGELKNGIIIDWKLFKDGSPSDSQMLPESLERIEEIYGKNNKPECITADRGFVSEPTKKYLSKNNIINHICPRSVNELKEFLKDDLFCENQNRRSQTEGRIGIFKNNFLGKPFRSKGFESRELNITWNVLAHNLWVIARLPQADNIQEQQIG